MSEDSENQFNNDVTGIQRGSHYKRRPETLRDMRRAFRVVFI